MAQDGHNLFCVRLRAVGVGINQEKEKERGYQDLPGYYAQHIDMKGDVA